MAEATPVHRLIEDLFHFFEKSGVHPKRDSPADIEIRTFKRPESVRTAYSHGETALANSQDHLQAVDRLVTEGQFSFSPWTCARGCLEASAYATWLLDPNINVTERVARSLAMRYYTLSEQRKMTNVDQDATGKKEINAQIVKVEELGHELGYQPITNKKGELEDIGTRKPPMTDLVRMQFPEHKGNIYRILSGIAHSNPSTLRQLGFMKESDGDHGGEISRAAVPRELQEMLLSNSAIFYTRGVWFHVIQYGFDAAGSHSRVPLRRTETQGQ